MTTKVPTRNKTALFFKDSFACFQKIMLKERNEFQKCTGKNDYNFPLDLFTLDFKYKKALSKYLKVLVTMAAKKHSEHYSNTENLLIVSMETV